MRTLASFSWSLLLATTTWSTVAFAASIGPSQSDLDHSAVATNTWLMTNKSYDGQRYVALDQINPTNVVRLKEICTFDTGVRAPAQSSPLLLQGRIYFTARQTPSRWTRKPARNSGATIGLYREKYFLP